MIIEYAIVYTVFAFITYGLSALCCNYRINEKQIKVVLLLLILANALIGAVRPEGTQDTSVYNQVYDNSLAYLSSVHITSIFDLFANRSYKSIEIAYIFLMAPFRYFLKSPVFFYFVQGLVSNSLMLYGLNLLCRYLLNANELKLKLTAIPYNNRLLQLYSLYVLFCGILYTSSAIRAGLSVSLGLIAVGNFLLKRNRIVSIILFLCSILLHTTSIILIPILLIIKLTRVRFSINTTIVICLMFLFMYFMRIARYIVGYITSGVSWLLDFANVHAFRSYITNLDYKLPLREGAIIAIVCFFLVLAYYKTKRVDKLTIIVVLGVCMFVIAYPVPALARLLYIFSLFLLPIVVSSTEVSKCNSDVIHYCSILFYVPQYVYVFSYVI